MLTEESLVREYMRVNDELCRQIQEDNMRLFLNPRDAVSQRSLTLQRQLFDLRFQYRNEFPTARIDQICPLLVKSRSKIGQSFFQYTSTSFNH